jgi:hypothetical protein
MNAWLDLPVFGTPPDVKERAFLDRLSELHRRHREHCPPYAALAPVATGFSSIADVPFLSVDLFKYADLRSVDQGDVSVVLQSSGTGARGRSRVALDQGTARLQSRILTRILAALLGPVRLPMLVIDSPPRPSAGELAGRSVASLGFMQAGRKHIFALDDVGRLDEQNVRRFVAEHGSQRCFVFGLTATIWEYLISSGLRIRLPGATVLHGGGWKKLEKQQVSREEFADRVIHATGCRAVRSYYGLVEQVGTIFLEDPSGALCAPVFGEVIIRDPGTLEPCQPGDTGLVQVLSGAPESYPGHSLLTGDLGRLLSPDRDDKWLGTRFEVLGRAPEADLRGCGNG